MGILQAHVPSGTSVALSSTFSTFVQSRSHVLNSSFHVYAAAHSQASCAVLVLVAFTTAVQLIPHVLSVLFHINFSLQTHPAVVAAIYSFEYSTLLQSKAHLAVRLLKVKGLSQLH